MIEETETSHYPPAFDISLLRLNHVVSLVTVRCIIYKLSKTKGEKKLHGSLELAKRRKTRTKFFPSKGILFRVSLQILEIIFRENVVM